MIQDGKSENQKMHNSHICIIVGEISGQACQSQEVRSTYIIPSPDTYELDTPGMLRLV